MKNLGKDIETCLEQILGARVSSPTRTKIKSGAAVYRITGNANITYDETTNKIFTQDPNSQLHKPIEVTLENKDDFKGFYIGNWEIALLQRGRERIRKELEEALIRRGHAVEVRIGGTNSGWYPASIAVEQLSRKVAPGDKINATKLAGELIALGEALAPLQKTLDDISLRLRALGIALTINLKSD